MILLLASSETFSAYVSALERPRRGLPVVIIYCALCAKYERGQKERDLIRLEWVALISAHPSYNIDNSADARVVVILVDI